jgi:uncharacterized surface protein with fasciclin (FAS1) repeats
MKTNTRFNRLVLALFVGTGMSAIMSAPLRAEMGVTPTAETPVPAPLPGVSPPALPTPGQGAGDLTAEPAPPDEMSETEAPAAETPAAETPAAETPATETPAAEVPPTTETPATETPAAETPTPETSETPPADGPVAPPADAPITPPVVTPGEPPATPGPSSSGETGSIVELAEGSDSFSTLSSAIKAAGLTETLSGDGPFTVFAPTNEAFAALPPGVLDSLLKPENKEVLVKVLSYHVVPQKLMAADLQSGSVATVEGGDAKVTVAPEGVTVNDAKVVQPDVEAKNGVIHAVDKVLVPPGL